MLDKLDVFDSRVRERAFRLWQEAGRPENSAEAFWRLALQIEMHDLDLQPKDLETMGRDDSGPAQAADFA